MDQWPQWLRSLMSVRIESGPLYVGVWLVVGTGLAALLIRQLLRADRRRAAGQLLCAGVCGAIGLLAAWLVSDVIMAFGVSLGWQVIGAVAVGFAMLGFLVITIVQTRRARRVIAALLVPLALMATAMRVDAVYGEYRTIGSLIGYSPYPLIGERTFRATTTLDEWNRMADDGALPSMPQDGELFAAHIPDTASGFHARPAMVYLPPAALSGRSPALPVMVMLAGQPGSPNRFFAASGIKPMLDEYARHHHGLAPIVVSPDQNGSGSRNSLCADTTKYGKAETYLTADVSDWMDAHLPVSTSAKDWTIGGFSQGGTCSVQLGARHPDRYGTIVAVGSEIEPSAGTVDQMVAEYFDGDRKAYEAQIPVKAIAAHAPSDQTMILAAGGKDGVSIDNARVIGAAGRAAGMTVVTLSAPDAGHDWHAVSATLEAALPWLNARMGLGEDDTTWADYPNVKELQ